jgi:hypothetical protein
VAPVEFTTNQTVAAARPRVLSPSTLIADWYTQRPALTDMRDQSAVVSLTANHNSITRTAPLAVVPAGVPTAPAGGFGFGATKQAAPPRGVPR